MRFDRTFQIFLLILLGAWIFLIYSNTAEVPFIFDDRIHIPDNLQIRLTEISFSGIWQAAFESPASSRPVANISFALNYYLHGYSLMGYHLVNILIHIAVAVILYFFAETTLSFIYGFSPKDKNKNIVFFCVLLWAVYPLHVQSVTYIVQRMNSMAALFYISSLLLYIKGRMGKSGCKKGIFFSGSLLCGLLALGTKQNTATLPFFIFLYEWYFFQDLNRKWLRTRMFYIGGAVLLFIIFIVLFLGLDPWEKILSAYQKRDFTLTERVLTQFRVIVFYISLILFPHPSRLNLDHYFTVSTSLFSPVSTFLSFCLVLAMIIPAFFLAARKERLISFSILWFFGHLLIESSVIGLELVFEHRTYLPSVAMIFLLYPLLNRFFEKLKWPGLILIACIFFLFSFWTYERNEVWGSRTALWGDSVMKSSQKARPHMNYGKALSEQGKPSEAIEQYSIALRIDPEYKDAHNNFAAQLIGLGRLSEAVEHLKTAIALDPSYAGAYNNLGSASVRLGNPDDALKYFRKALALRPDFADAHYNIGVFFQQNEQFSRAVEHYQAVIYIDPGYVRAYVNLGICFYAAGNVPQAVRFFERALEKDPDNIKALYNLQQLRNISTNGVEAD